MTEQQIYKIIENKDLLIARVNEMFNNGYRLVQISATKKDNYDLLYSFAKKSEFIHLRLAVDFGDSIDSISGIFPYSYLYENEIKDLFGLQIRNINFDFKGNFYKVKAEQ
ncbi:MAG: NADH-quinone oxidoreductase subunit C [Oscillospiraceae bacterium]|jgi:ech hydrogenase subunit D|nr:NADH-quinone oxidoreductase subunit C [Oscillospiraceae bacterium]